MRLSITPSRKIIAVRVRVRVEWPPWPPAAQSCGNTVAFAWVYDRSLLPCAPKQDLLGCYANATFKVLAWAAQAALP